jgi:phosphoglucosamine mutase
MSRKYFGTDGVRGKVGDAPITPEFVMHLGYAAGKVLAGGVRHGPAADPPAVLIGKDTRISGYMLESALQAGLSAAGVDIYLSGPIPTPAVAYLPRTIRSRTTASSSFRRAATNCPMPSSRKSSSAWAIRS